MSIPDQDLVPLLNAGWHLNETKTAISKRFTFPGFAEAFGWMTQVALIAERLNHHPDWSNSYRSVDVTLTTHSAGGLSDLDVKLGTRMEALATR